MIQPREVFHIVTGREVMNGVDAASAVSNHPLEWSYRPWTPEILEEAKEMVRRRDELNNPRPVGALKLDEQP
jgi:hypothetical protein